MPGILAHAIEDSTDIFGISGGGVEHPKPPPSVRHWFWIPKSREICC